MRRTLGALTLRGRAFLASGLTAVVCGLVLRERDLTRMGLLVAVLPLAAALFVVRRSQHLSVRREPTADRVGVGDTVRVAVRVENGGPGTGVLLLEEHVPDELGGAPRFVVPALGRSEVSRLEYSATPTTRGRHQVGPMTVRRREPFGMVEVQQELSGSTSVLVLPQVVPLPALRLSGGRFSTGEESPRSYSIGTVADVVVRDYRRGDDLRRIHWRSTARTGDLMVRNEEQLWQARAVVVLDNRRARHRGNGAGSSLESAVVAAASVVAHLRDADFTVRLVTADGVVDGRTEPGRPPDAAPLLDALAVVGLSGATTMPDLSTGEDSAPGVAVAVMGDDRPEDRPWWSRLTGRGAQGLALRLDVEDWAVHTGTRTQVTPPAWLLQQGWHVAVLDRRTSLPTAWRGLL
ncbi:membrane protein [Marmoricola endophyticus]|uniref:Membrane protein n=1 Tax=Marmoricola endophyticus TaxID=2040280 RepID=A0A917BDD0_9ACTN|nr:DUF58 domain-containing protein [Marmoricola endophyticus]GGF38013.1 membrane protein [Marmoricola endophyticus]